MKRNHSQFTLVEMLIVVVVIAILFSLLMPSLSQAKYVASQELCKSNLSRITSGITAYAHDYNGKYPDGRTGNYMEGKITSWKVQNQLQFNALAQYYSGGVYGNFKDLTPVNEVWRCPQGVNEVSWDPSDYAYGGTEAFYSTYFNTYSGCSNRAGSSPNYYFETPERVMRKIGDKFTFDAFRNNWGWTGIDNLKYDILASDVTHRYSNSGVYIGTNHIWGGERTLFNIAPLRFAANTGIPTINYAFTDGSVRDYTTDASSWRDDMHMSGRAGGFGGDAYILPKAWGEE